MTVVAGGDRSAARFFRPRGPGSAVLRGRAGMDALSWFSRLTADPSTFQLRMDFVVFDDVAVFRLSHSAAVIEREIGHVDAVSLGYLFYFVLDGSVVLSQNDTSFRLTAGSSAVASGHTPHRLEVTDRSDMILVALRRGALRGRGLPGAQDDVHLFPGTSLPAAVARFLDSLASDLPRPLSPEGIASRLAILQLLAGVVTGTAEEPDRSPRQAEWAAQALTYIGANYSDPNMTTAAVATATGISPRHLQRVLAGVNNSVADELRRTRVRWATVSLRSSRGLSLGEVAAFSGFGTVPRMRRAFQREIGMSPGDFRRFHRPATNHGLPF